MRGIGDFGGLFALISLHFLTFYILFSLSLTEVGLLGLLEVRGPLAVRAVDICAAYSTYPGTAEQAKRSETVSDLARRIDWNLSTVRSLQHSLAIVVARVAKTVVPVQPFPYSVCSNIASQDSRTDL